VVVVLLCQRVIQAVARQSPHKYHADHVQRDTLRIAAVMRNDSVAVFRELPVVSSLILRILLIPEGLLPVTEVSVADKTQTRD